MALIPELLPAQQTSRQEIVLLHGWGANREVWRPLVALLRPWANVSLLDIPGCAPGSAVKPGLELTQVLEDILAGVSGPAVYVGWSLGGQLALELAVPVSPPGGGGGDGL